ncbi:hypothetical protein ASD8599_02668 [Ascidiaceihabitans donghaensis]|uniref:Protein-export membrane protein SecG n=1 Tax=Ascidiaceihabitans donghaensis TaxID=1510460 RepID=A0A2R8BG42_9RHOB|nr:preprotein translocase subunit SecG [Ascidiaceihabitans donghaensis]SPH21918.1 hypothetical protein ASD8599_02668 [Ascidiaceihabitans donghaensis]
MENVVLIIHLILSLGLVGIVLVQRSEGGGLGMGGGGGGNMSGRPPASPMAKFTWILAVGFIITSVTLTIIAAQNASGSSVVDRLGVTPSQAGAEAPALPGVDDLLPPSEGENAPLVPSAD